MPKKEKQNKTGSAGRFGPRYGTKARERVRSVEEEMEKDKQCPKCEARKVKRMGSGIWKCNRCGTKFTAKAYKPTLTPLKRKDVVEGEETSEE